MSEWKLFPDGTIPEWTTPEWYAGRETAPHLEQEGHRERLLLTAKVVVEAISMGAASVVDLGAGDGGLLSLVPKDIAAWGYDLQQTNVDAAAKRGVDVRLEDVVGGDRFPMMADCVVATEFLEHLVDPHALVRRVATTQARFLVASSPYTENDKNHYGFHTWAWDEGGYRKMLENNGWWVIRQEKAWISQVLLAVKK